MEKENRAARESAPSRFDQHAKQIEHTFAPQGDVFIRQAEIVHACDAPEDADIDAHVRNLRQQLREARQAAGVSQRVFAKVLGTSQSQLSHMERGKKGGADRMLRYLSALEGWAEPLPAPSTNGGDSQAFSATTDESRPSRVQSPRGVTTKREAARHAIRASALTRLFDGLLYRHCSQRYPEALPFEEFTTLLHVFQTAHHRTAVDLPQMLNERVKPRLERREREEAIRRDQGTPDDSAVAASLAASRAILRLVDRYLRENTPE